MTPQIERHFNTAARFLISCIFASSALAHAQDSSVQTDNAHIDDVCPLLFDTQAGDMNGDGQYGWWFSPNTSAARDALQTQTLPFVHAQAHMLITDADEILVKLPTDFSSRDAAPFLIVRITPIKTGRYRPALGDFIEIVGQAELDSASDIIQLPDSNGNNANTVTTPLRISHASREILPSDRILMRRSQCSKQTDLAATPAAEPIIIDDKQIARTTALLNRHIIGAKETAFTIDKGRTQGVQIGQTWRLLDTLAKGSNAAKPFGDARVVQVFDEMSILVVDDASHELQVDTLLQIKTTTP